MSLKEAVLTGLATSAAIPSVFVGTCVGTLFAPGLAATAGGTAVVLGATAIGLKLAFLPTVFFSSMAALSSNPISRIGFSMLAAASFTAGIALGAAILGLSTQALLPCIGLGVAIAALGALTIIGLTRICLNSFLEELNETYTPANI
ncbi:MAG: hypothetical protein K0U37_01785 [Gammaproteobacteria bacterium]|nr:hypothetical protein [Gammaproteobacteria bacterium]